MSNYEFLKSFQFKPPNQTLEKIQKLLVWNYKI